MTDEAFMQAQELRDCPVHPDFCKGDTWRLKSLPPIS